MRHSLDMQSQSCTGTQKKKLQSGSNTGTETINVIRWAQSGTTFICRCPLCSSEVIPQDEMFTGPPGTRARHQTWRIYSVFEFLQVHASSKKIHKRVLLTRLMFEHVQRAAEGSSPLNLTPRCLCKCVIYTGVMWKTWSVCVHWDWTSRKQETVRPLKWEIFWMFQREETSWNIFYMLGAFRFCGVLRTWRDSWTQNITWESCHV